MKRIYVITVDNGELSGLIYELLTCEYCAYFREHDRSKQQPYSCMHPDGPINPVPDGFCNYAAEKYDE